MVCLLTSVNTLFTGGTVLTSLACAWPINILLLGTEKQQLLIIISIYLNNEAVSALCKQTKGQKLAERKAVCLCTKHCRNQHNFIEDYLYIRFWLYYGCKL